MQYKKRNYSSLVSLAGKRILLVVLLAGLSGMHTAMAQLSVPVGMTGFDDQLRILQLQGKLGIDHSLMARPFFADRSITMDSIFHMVDGKVSYPSSHKAFMNGKVNAALLPLSLYTKFNSDHPYSWNQPGFIQAKGLQTLVSTGVYASAGWFSVQLKPELVLANNPMFPHNSNWGAPTTGNYRKVFMGQSAVRLTKAGVSLGLSTENIWWGPGVHNSLLMSSNAPGFLHATFNTVKPIQTAIGNFEWQLISGKLTEDTSLLLENKSLTTRYYNPANYDGSGYSWAYDPRKKWRYLNGITLSYNPKWIKGLFLSVSRVGYTYKTKLDSVEGYNFFQKYFPVFFGVMRKSYPYGSPSQSHDIGYKQMASLAARFVFPNSQTEVYAEYGFGDNFYNLRDMNTDAPHSRAYIVGFKKLKALNKGKWLDIGAEITHMSEPVNYLLRTAGDWYSYQGGYTNQGRIIGAGLGQGNNAFTLRANVLSGFSRMGVIIQGLQHRPVAVVGGLPNFGIRETKWNDFSIGISGQKKFNRLILNAELQAVNANNYGWENGNNRFNLYGFLAATYLW
ncbi:capsule assembly Wzi family protein [Sediminibacterium roseum]|uniref:Capsule assembly Wzi family protein n=1 Tax=Sediminibacterium roseum TaxID=1978412 RepID=A0ABW9ZPV0_9BACT|nr:capsule assembly Wzi family protein [Sediminibacterium roseum]NCI49113.1 capsule assembly Wzi family protein [Sediminibacterium roseum]